MSEPNQESGSWRTAAPNRRYESRQWRHSARTKQGFFSRLPLRVRKLAWGLITLAVSGVILWLLTLPWRTRIPPLQVEAMGASIYHEDSFPPNTFGREDVAAFEALEKLYLPQDALHVAAWHNQLNANVLSSEFSKDFADDVQDKNLIVFCSLHGAVVPKGSATEAKLFAIDAEADSPHTRSNKMVSVPHVLKQLQAARSKHVLLLIDISRLRPNWRLGVLANDVAWQLEQHVTEYMKNSNVPNLRVMCSAAPGQQSWTPTQDESREWPHGLQSVFGHFTIEGLKGAADDNGDRRVSFRELFQYVKQHVAEWSREHRGVAQTVWTLPALDENGPSGKDFDLLAVVDLTAEVADAERNSAKDENKESAENTKAKNDATEADRDGENNKEDDKGERASSDATTSKSSATSKPEEKQDDANTANRSDIGEGAKSPAAVDANSASDRASQTAALLADCRAKLAKLWKQRDQLREEGVAAGVVPHRWRSLQAHLQVAEQRIRAHAFEKAGDSLEICDELLTETRTAKGFSSLTEKPATLLTLSSAFNAPASSKSSDATDADGAKLAADFHSAAINVLKAEKEEDLQKAQEGLSKLFGEHPSLLRDDLSLRRQLVESIFNSTHSDCTPSNLNRLSIVVDLIDPNHRPSELVLVRQLINLAATWSADVDGPWPQKDCRGILQLRRQAEQIAIDEPQVLPIVRPQLEQGLKNLVAAERWLLARGSRFGQVEEPYGKARTTLDQVRQRAEQVQQAIRLRDQLLAELPDFARWVASRAERDASLYGDWGDKIRLAGMNWRKPDQAAVLRCLGKGSVDSRLLKLTFQLKKLNSALWQDDANVETVNDIADETERGWREFRESFDSRVRRVANRESSASWQEIDDLLIVPWIHVADRGKLLDLILYEKDFKTGVLGAKRSSSTGDSQIVPGIWQGFWAIQTLSLSGTDVSKLWLHWSDLVKVASRQRRDQPGIVKRRALLGLEINEFWRRMADDLTRDSDVNRSMSAAQKESLARAIDGMDLLEGEDDPADQVVLSRRKQQLAELLRFRLRHWNFSDQFPAHDGLVDRSLEVLKSLGMQQADIPQANSRSAALSIEVKRFVARTRTAPLKVSILDAASRPADTDGKNLRVKFLPPDVEVLQADGSAVKGPVPVTEAELLKIRLPKTMRTTQRFTAVLLDETGFPLVIKQHRLDPPVDPSEWDIVFKTIKEQRVYQRLATQGMKLFLPAFRPQTGAYVLQPFLKRPKNVAASKADISVFVKGTQRRIAQYSAEFQSSDEVDSRDPDDSKLTRLSGDSEQPKPKDADKKDDANRKKQPQLNFQDITAGLEFRIVLKDEPQPIIREVQPVFWPATSIVSTVKPPRVEFEKSRLLVTVFPNRIEDLEPGEVSLLPEKLPLQLHISEELRELEPNGDQTGWLVMADPKGTSIELTFDEAKLERIDNKRFDIALSVAGLPHAFRWSVGYRQAARPGRFPWISCQIVTDPKAPKTVVKQGRTRQGTKYAVIKHGTTYRIRFQIDLGDEPDWRLGWQNRLSGSRRQPNSETQTLSSAYDQTVRVAIDKGTWHIATSAADYVREFPAAGIGRYTFSARLLNFGVVPQTGDRRTRDEILLAIDNDRPPQTLQWLGPAVDSVHDNDRSLRVELKADDRESGIEKLVVGVDRDKDEQLSKQETIAIVNPDLLDKKLFSQIIPVEKLPGLDKEGTFNLLAVATNGVGQTAKSKRPIRLRIPDKRKFGSVQVRPKYLGKYYSWRLTGPNTETTNRNYPLRIQISEPISFTRLSPGKYTIEFKKRNSKPQKFSFQVKAGENRQIVVDVR